ncbi:MAG: FAD-binding oxidoreductase [Porticoccus sp.]|nr:FAD-binding oxidoreductase [Porticoccus sp.]MBQ0808346.1 FAD-binding oxidoreductase [Porticoccus sp.]
MAIAPSVIDIPLSTIEQLRDIVGDQRVLTDDVSFQQYGVDRTTIWQPAPGVIVLPGSTEEVQAIVQLANAENLAVVPSGGRTGLSGGAVATNGEIVIAMDRMNKVVDFNEVDRTVTVEAGMITQQLQAFAEDKGLFYPVDFASTGSSQIGGNIATNAGGIKVIRYGMTRDWVMGLKVVDGNGNIMELNRGLVKNNTGLDFRHLFIGSEGVLGIITEATMRLTRKAPELSVLVLGVADFPSIMGVLKTFNEGMSLTAFEFFSHNGMEKVIAHSEVPAPFETVSPFYVLIEFEQSSEADLEQAMALFETCMEEGWVEDGTISQSLSQAENLWKLREDLSETLWQWKPYKNDISVSVSKMPAFIEKVDALVAEQYPDFEIVWFGHIGDGNIHLNILKPDDLTVEAFTERCGGVSQQVAALIQAFNGSVSAEHGVGLLKKDYLSYTRTETELQLMRQIKKVFDPKGIMNPGKLVDVAD